MPGRSRQAVRGRSGLPSWMAFVAGIVVGAGLATAAFMSGHAPDLRRGDVPTPNPTAATPGPGDTGIADKTGKSNQDYDFYRVLPEMEVVIPDAELAAKARAEAAKTATAATTAATPSAPGATPTPAATGGSYLLQAGSFPNAGDADSMKARLALLGFTANVQPVTINGSTWHRVRLGPYKSASDLEAAKQKLAASGVNVIALKEQQ